MSAAILFGSMAVMIGFGIPIAIVLGVSSALTLIFSGAPLGVIPSMMQATVQKFSLLTIPLFVLAGAIMDKGGISKRLINLADSIIGPVHGGLGYVAVVAALFFAAISGSGTATVAAMGSILIPAMVAQGYDAGFSRPFRYIGLPGNGYSSQYYIHYLWHDYRGIHWRPVPVRYYTRTYIRLHALYYGVH